MCSCTHIYPSQGVCVGQQERGGTLNRGRGGGVPRREEDRGGVTERARGGERGVSAEECCALEGTWSSQTHTGLTIVLGLYCLRWRTD